MTSQPLSSPLLSSWTLFKRPNHQHWTAGGTGVTNFSTDHTQRYVDAIHRYEEQHNDTHGFFIRFHAMGDPKYKSMFSLHCSSDTVSFTDFWLGYEAVKAGEDNARLE